MTIKSSLGCGCNDNTYLFDKTKISSCCEVQEPPRACCEPHKVIHVPGMCLYATCKLVATVERFTLTFQKNCVDLPIGPNFKFAHQAAGLLNIHGCNGTSYEVSIFDPTKEGAVIEPEDCIFLTFIPSDSTSNAISGRCLSGNFAAPDVGGTETIYIFNGSGIPQGSTITFTWNGETGSYLVNSFDSASGSIYAYVVTNTGGGLTPGTIVQGGTQGACDVPIEVITDVDICDLSPTQVADTLTACLNGSPMAFVPTAEGSVPRGTAEGTWGQAQLANFDCCIFTDACLKFSGESCLAAEDTITIRDTSDLTCFNEAWDESVEAGTSLVARIGNLRVYITAWNPETLTLSLRPIDPDYFGESEFLQFEEGTAICLGECCNQCTNGPQVTNTNNLGYESGDQASVFVFAVTVDTPATEDGPMVYLIGQDGAGAVVAVELDATYNDDLEPGIGKPFVTDPLVMRQKVCNTSIRGCDQIFEIYYNYDLAVSNLQKEMRMHYEVADYIYSSDTLADGTTPNPYFSIASQAASAGYIDGPSTAPSLDTTITPSTALGVGGPLDVKVYPYIANSFMDMTILKECDCANIRTWFLVRFEPIDAGVTASTASILLGIRRYLKKDDLSQIDYPANDPELEGFNV